MSSDPQLPSRQGVSKSTIPNRIPERTRSDLQPEIQNVTRPLIRSVFPTPPRRPIASTAGGASHRADGPPTVGRALKSGARASSHRPPLQGRPNIVVKSSAFSVKKTTGAGNDQRHSAPSFVTIPSRARLPQQKWASSANRPRSSFPIISAPARKAGSRSSNVAIQQNAPVHIPSKTPSTLLPLWKDLDREHEERSRRNKRAHGELGGFTRRMTSSANRRGAAPAADVIRLDEDSPNRPKAHISSRMTLEVDGVLEVLESEEDEIRYRSVRKVANRKVASDIRPQVALKKAARKFAYTDTSSSSSDSSEDDESMQTRSDIDELDVDNYTPPPVPMPLPPEPPTQDVEMGEAARDFSPPQILLLDTPPKITIPLPQINPAPVIVVDQVTQPYPPEELLTALEALTLPSMRMQSTRQLPFLRRNLRQGFLKRCRGLEVDVYSSEDVALTVLYEYAGGISYEAEVSDWMCPLCDLFGSFETREMLGCHLSWDHPDVFHEWHKLEEDEDKESWKLQVLISEAQEARDGAQENTSRHGGTQLSVNPRVSLPPIVAKVEEQEDQEEEDQEEEEGLEEPQEDELMTPVQLIEHPPSTPQTRNIPSSPFPSVSLSPPSVRRQSTLGITTTPSKPPLPRQKVEFSVTSSVGPSTQSVEPPPSVTSSSRRSTTQTTSSGSRSRSTTGTTLTTTTTTATTTTTTTRATTTATPRVTTSTARPSGNSRCLTPPPQDDPLGPAARAPYLPAKSDYGGPTVYYSSRPGGPCLFDLLGTLPMDKFGVLDWDVIDREEEIYETDEVKEEYKVMHALWARWILLNRTKFIANYLEGAILFVDDYWKIIHRAAGWDALRYWLLILAVDQFLNANDIRKILLHYEDLTGMASWYD